MKKIRLDIIIGLIILSTVLFSIAFTMDTAEGKINEKIEIRDEPRIDQYEIFKDGITYRGCDDYKKGAFDELRGCSIIYNNEEINCELPSYHSSYLNPQCIEIIMKHIDRPAYAQRDFLGLSQGKISDHIMLWNEKYDRKEASFELTTNGKIVVSGFETIFCDGNTFIGTMSYPSIFDKLIDHNAIKTLNGLCER